ncbi:MAG: ArnT family glycosyltransferase [Candidatus Glassbacteria bacterium]
MKAKTILLAWLLIFALLVGSTLNNTRPYQGDESIYITSAIRMIEGGNYLVPEYFGNMRFQKPILPYWVTVAGYRIFGIHLWSGRSLFLLISCMTLMLVYHFSKLLSDDLEFSLMNVFLLSSSTLFFEFSRVSMTDLLLTFFMTASLFFFCRALQDPASLKRNYMIAYGSMGCGFMSKGFLGTIPVFAMLIYLLIMRPGNYKKHLKNLFSPINLLIFSLIVLPWYTFVFLNYSRLASKQLLAESSQLLPDATSIIGNTAFYAKILVTNYFPVTTIAVIMLFKRRIRFPGVFGLPLAYMILLMAVLVFSMKLNKSRYLLTMFPTLTLFAGYTLHRSNMTTTMRNVSIAVLCLHVGFFQFYSSISGEPVKELVMYWNENENGDLALFGLDNKRMSWAQALSNGKLMDYNDGIKYLIVPEKELGGFTGYEVIADRDRIKKLYIEDFKFTKEKRNFYLLKRLE